MLSVCKTGDITFCSDEHARRGRSFEDYLLTGCLDTCFEIDGGIHATFSSPGDEPIVFRDRNNLREVLTEMMKRKP
jgi:hypothetical protein